MLFVSVALAIGIAVFWPIAKTYRYLPVTGVINKSEIIYCGVEVGGYRADVRFAYVIDARQYFDGRQRLDFGEICDSEKNTSFILGRYPVGKEVHGWYDPEHPEVAILERTLGPIQKFYLGLMGGFAVIFLFKGWVRRSTTARRKQFEAKKSGEVV